jgi:FkbM family methyltransferase
MGFFRAQQSSVSAAQQQHKHCALLAAVVALQGFVSVVLLFLYLSSHTSTRPAGCAVPPVPLSLAQQLQAVADAHQLPRVLLYEVMRNNGSAYRPPFLMLCHEPGEWICDRLLQHRQYEAQLYDDALFSLARQHRLGDVLFVDVGANMGLWSVFWASRGVRTLAFEAAAHNVARLRANGIVNGVGDLIEVHTVAVGERNGTLRISSFKQNSGVGYVHDRDNDDPTVAVWPLSHFATLREHCAARRPVFAKIDVEGSEMGVLRGGMQFLQSACVRSFFIELLPNFHAPTEILGVGMLFRSFGYTLRSPYTDQWWLHDAELLEQANARAQSARLAARLLCVEHELKKWADTSLCKETAPLSDAELDALRGEWQWTPALAHSANMSLAGELAFHRLYDQWRDTVLARQ